MSQSWKGWWKTVYIFEYLWQVRIKDLTFSLTIYIKCWFIWKKYQSRLANKVALRECIIDLQRLPGGTKDPEGFFWLAKQNKKQKQNQKSKKQFLFGQVYSTRPPWHQQCWRAFGKSRTTMPNSLERWPSCDNFTDWQICGFFSHSSFWEC